MNIRAILIKSFFIYIFSYLCFGQKLKAMKLELEHLAPYLPYELKAKMEIFGDNETIVDVVGCVGEFVFLDGVRKTISEQFFIHEIKPILRPLSDIVTYFHNAFADGKFEEYLDADFLENHSICGVGELENIKVGYLPYGTFELLVKHHFDVFDLIPNGLAIDINTLK